MQIKEFSEADLQRIYEDTVRAELKKTAVEQVAAFFRRDGERTVRTTTEQVCKDLVPYMKQRAEEWVSANMDALIDRKAQELVQAAIGGIKRRMGGRG